MKKIMAILVLLALVISIFGCGDGETETIKPTSTSEGSVKTPDTSATVVKKDDAATSEPATVKAPAAKEPAAAEPVKEVSYELSSEEKAKLESQMKMGIRTAISSTFKTVNKGEVVVIGMGVVNNENDAVTYRIKPKVEKVQKTLGPGSYEELTTTADLTEWLDANKFSDFTIGAKSQRIVPVIIKIGDTVTPNHETEAGIRINLQIEVKSMDKGFERDYSEETISIKVE